MTEHNPEKEIPSEVLGALSALQRAADMARQVAIQTDTAIVVVRDGKTVRIPAEELRKAQAAGNGAQNHDRDHDDIA